MNLVDSHTHLYFNDYPDQGEVVKRAINSGVVHMILPGVNSSTIEPVRNLHNLFPLNTSMAVGLHPSDVLPETWEKELSLVAEELEKHCKEYIAIGEVGIDLHWEKDHLLLQQEAFRRQIKMALKYSLPLIIHSRDAFEETHSVLAEFAELPKLVFHSYSGDIEETKKILSLYPEVYFGINGIVTFKKAQIKYVLPYIPDDRLMLETDAPYLSPVPHRGKTNESAFLVNTAQFIADEKNMPLEELAHITSENVSRCFGIKIC